MEKPGDREAAFAVRVAVPEDEREAVPAAGPGVGDRGHDVAEGVAHAEGELVRHRRLRLVVDQVDLGVAGAAGGDDGVEARLAQVGVSPGEGRLSVARLAIRREAERPHRELEAEALVEARVVEDAVVVAAVAAEDHRAAVAPDVVGEADARLEAALEGRAVVAIGEVVAGTNPETAATTFAGVT